jgi:hypothetical protein
LRPARGRQRRSASTWFAGFNEVAEGSAGENVALPGRPLEPVGPASFRFNPTDPLDLVADLDAATEGRLTFRPLPLPTAMCATLACCAAGSCSPWLLQRSLRFRGRDLSLDELPGVTEDQDMLW